MPRKRPTTEASSTTVTIQQGLDVALGDGTVQKPELQILQLANLTGIPAKPDPKYDAETWPLFVESCRTGLEEAIKVRPNADGTYEIRDGRHRALAYRLLRKTEIPATVRTDWSDDKKAALGEFKLNSMRAFPTPYEQAQGFQRALDAGMTTAEIAAQVGITEATVKDRLRLVTDGFPEAIARRIGVDLEHKVADYFTGLMGHPELLQAAAAAKIKPGMASWQIEREVQAAVVKTGLVANTSLDYERKNAIGGYENKTYDKRAKALPVVQVGDAVYTTDPAGLKEIYADELAKAKARMAEVGRGKKGKDGKKESAADVEQLLTRRAQNRAVALQRELAAKRIGGLVSWNDDKELRMVAVVLDYRVAKKADWDFLVAATGMEQEKLQEIVERSYHHDGADGWEKAVKKLWKDDRLQLHKILAAVLCLRDMGYDGHFSHDGKGKDDDCEAWTGKEGKEIYGTAKAEVRAAMKESAAKRAEKDAKAGKAKKPAKAAKAVKPKKGKRGAGEDEAPASDGVVIDNGADDVHDMLDDGDDQGDDTKE